MITAFSAARDGATANAAIASAPAAQSERVKRVRRIGFPFLLAADGRSLGWSRTVRKVGAALRHRRYALTPALLPRQSHEFVTKSCAIPHTCRARNATLERGVEKPPAA